MKKLIVALLFAVLCSAFLVPVASAHTAERQAGCVNYPPGWPIDSGDNTCPPQGQHQYHFYRVPQQGDQGPGASNLCDDPYNLLGCNGTTTHPWFYCGGEPCGHPRGDIPPVVSHPWRHHPHYPGLLNHPGHPHSVGVPLAQVYCNWRYSSPNLKQDCFNILRALGVFAVCQLPYEKGFCTVGEAIRAIRSETPSRNLAIFAVCQVKYVKPLCDIGGLLKALHGQTP